MTLKSYRRKFDQSKTLLFRAKKQDSEVRLTPRWVAVSVLGRTVIEARSSNMGNEGSILNRT